MSALEEWRAVVGYEGLYEVSDRGRVRSLDRVVPHRRNHIRRLPGTILSPVVSANRTKHLRVGLWRDGVMTKVYIHHVVLEAFIGARPEGLLGCHADDNPTNNALVNLRWATPSENAQDAVRNGRHPTAGRSHCARGHEHNEQNTRFVGNRRHCRVCFNLGAARRREQEASR